MMPQASRAASFSCSIRNPTEGNVARLHIKNAGLDMDH